MQDKKDRDKRDKKKDSKHQSESEFETFALAGGKRDPKSGTTIPPEEGVIAAKKFVEENKK